MCPCFLPMCFSIYALSWKRVFLVKCHEKKTLIAKFKFLLISHSVLVKFHKSSGLYCLLKVSPCALDFFYLCVFQFDAPSGKKGVLCKFSIFTNVSFSFCQNLMGLHTYIIYLKFHHVQLFFFFFFIYAKLCYLKRVLNVFFFFFFLLSK